MRYFALGSPTSLTLRLAVLCLAVLAAIGAAGCEQALVTAPSSSVLTISASSSAVDLGGVLLITAIITDSSGKAVTEGTLVTFSSTLGRVEPAETHVSNGRATVQLIAGTTPGVASISAASGAAKSSVLDIRVGPVTSRIVLATSAGGAGVASIVATVFDAKGFVIGGVPVAFTTSAGTLATAVVYTDPFGQAIVSLYTLGDAIVTAESMGVRATIAVRAGGTGTLTVNIAMNPAAPLRYQTVIFTASVVSSGGGPTVPIERYEWDWGGGYVVITTGNATARAFETEGRYGVTVKVYGIDGSVGTSRIEFYVD